MGELADPADLGSVAEMHPGSSPGSPTNIDQGNRFPDIFFMIRGLSWFQSLQIGLTMFVLLGVSNIFIMVN